MREGLNLVQVTGAYHGYAVTLVGWLRRVSGDEWELSPGHVTVMRTGERDLGGLDKLCAAGPAKRYATSEPARMPESIHRLLVRRCKPCDEKAWQSLVPRPSGWEAR